MSRMTNYIVPPEDDGTARCILCLDPMPVGEEWRGVCADCEDALKGRFQAMLRDFFDEDELAWMMDENDTTGKINDWFREVVEKG